MHKIFVTKAAFETWHEQWKHDHGYPLQGRNAETGELVDVGWTTEYTDYESHPKKTDRRVICVVDGKDAISGAKELNISEKTEWEMGIEAMEIS